jgi:hypothetical protein
VSKFAPPLLPARGADLGPRALFAAESALAFGFARSALQADGSPATAGLLTILVLVATWVLSRLTPPGTPGGTALI